jgi:8-oxo-dGTP pyrophosphatase MutT (NUDIX family)
VSIPQFGTPDPTATYTLRPGAYALIRLNALIATIRTPTTITFPGGGQDPDESLTETAVRETREECGLKIKILRFLGLADQLVHATQYDQHFRKRCHFFAARYLSQFGPGEPDHELLWLLPNKALSSLKGGANIWALQKFLESES